MTRKEFKERFNRAIELSWNELLHIHAVYIYPTRRKHESGFAIMSMLIELADGRDVKQIGCCDDIALNGTHFRIECDYPSGIIHLWNSRNIFCTSSRLSSISFTEVEGKRYESMDCTK